MSKAIIVQGGYKGHEPVETSAEIEAILSERGFEVDRFDSLEPFADGEKMKTYDVIVPHWTMGELTGEQFAGLREAVAAGSGLAGCHGGAGDAFRANSNYQYMVGGQFVAHPGGIVDYTVNIVDGDDPITKGIGDFAVTSEMYYMHVDPGNEVLATITFTDQPDEWIAGTVMPAVWKRRYGKGRVFYCSLGHVASEFKSSEFCEILGRGMAWASR